LLGSLFPRKIRQFGIEPILPEKKYKQ